MYSVYPIQCSRACSFHRSTRQVLTPDLRQKPLDDFLKLVYLLNLVSRNRRTIRGKQTTRALRFIVNLKYHRSLTAWVRRYDHTKFTGLNFTPIKDRSIPCILILKNLVLPQGVYTAAVIMGSRRRRTQLCRERGWTMADAALHEPGLHSSAITNVTAFSFVPASVQYQCSTTVKLLISSMK
eukprot:SAG31_NODE_1506_length_8076_cov_13.880657_5_plen_182_part_00